MEAVREEATMHGEMRHQKKKTDKQFICPFGSEFAGSEQIVEYALPRKLFYFSAQQRPSPFSPSTRRLLVNGLGCAVEAHTIHGTLRSLVYDDGPT